MKFLPLLLLLLCSAAQAGSKIADACSELTNRDPALTKNCVNHAELFEVEAPFIRAVTQFHRSVEVRMKALKKDPTYGDPLLWPAAPTHRSPASTK